MSKKKPKHEISYESLMSWGCLCGGRWMNEYLRGKSDMALEVERDEAFAHHVREMERQGYA